MKRQRNDNSNGGSRKNGGKHITFLRGENKITYVKPPPKSENPNLWFKEGEAITTKPLNFIIPADSAVNMEISTNVTLKHMSIVFDESEENAKKNEKVTMGSSKNSSGSGSGGSAQQKIERCTLEIAMRDLESELKLAKTAPKSSNKDKVAEEEERIVNANKFYAVGTVAVLVGGSNNNNHSKDASSAVFSSYQPFSHTPLKTSLINGIYVLRNTGTRPIALMAMAVDVETRLE